MHIEKNVWDNLLGTLMNIEGKTNDTYKTCLDLEDLGIMHELHPICRDGGVHCPMRVTCLKIYRKKIL